MSDESEVPVEPIHFTQGVVLTVERWPQRIAVTEDFLRHAHVNKATVEGDTVTFTVDNGTATYRLRRDLPKHGRGIVADLVEGDTPGRLRQRAQKFGTVI